MKIFSKTTYVRMLAAINTAMSGIGLTSRKQTTQGGKHTAITQAGTNAITEDEVMEAQKAWGDGIVHIGKVYLSNGDYVAAATEHINNFYSYQEGSVLFKPTLTWHKQFRTDFEGALSYYVGGNSNYPEDKGFALKPHRSVRWDNVGIKIIGNMAVAMGDYYFTPAKGGEDVKAEYSFAYTKDKAGRLKIILHDSHFPYKPAEEP